MATVFQRPETQLASEVFSFRGYGSQHLALCFRHIVIVVVVSAFQFAEVTFPCSSTTTSTGTSQLPEGQGAS